MAGYESLIAKTAVAFNKARAKVFPLGVKCFLLSADGEDVPYKVEKELETNWFADKNSKGVLEVNYATLEEDFPGVLDLSSHVLFQGDVYKIDDSLSAPPMPTQPYFYLACNRTGEKFTPPT